MQYFVSIENTSYFYWQINLLIESFKKLKLEDSLVIAIAENETEPKNMAWAKNLLYHPHKVMHENYGLINNFLPMNKPMGIVIAMQQGLLKDEEFVILHPDMALVQPIDMEGCDENLVFQQSFFPLHPTWQELFTKNFPANPPPIPWDGGTIYCKNMPKSFFESVVSNTMWLKSTEPNIHELAKLGWILSMYQYIGAHSVTIQTMKFEKELIDHKQKNPIIHYRHGMPPIFNKRFYKNNVGLDQDPYKALMSYNPTDAIEYMQKLIIASKK
jgi:hypothetical protein